MDLTNPSAIQDCTIVRDLRLSAQVSAPRPLSYAHGPQRAVRDVAGARAVAPVVRHEVRVAPLARRPAGRAGPEQLDAAPSQYCFSTGHLLDNR